ncbi:hypothetical protein K0M31_010170 [Melipona bicolor]|uniref:Uncharacterized protein n=1 Tax=Melipona bicolor TaxID=60889 RepID=A0AA40FME3_9HYME|nr:hypothetical protein K0M31_010170 [Melipona bicolor]
MAKGCTFGSPRREQEGRSSEGDTTNRRLCLSLLDSGSSPKPRNRKVLTLTTLLEFLAWKLFVFINRLSGMFFGE